MRDYSHAVPEPAVVVPEGFRIERELSEMAEPLARGRSENYDYVREQLRPARPASRKEETSMGVDNHDRLDKVLHSEEYLEMKCGSLGLVREVLAGQTGHVLKVGPDGVPVQEKKYCGPDCPTLISEHVAAAAPKASA